MSAEPGGQRGRAVDGDDQQGGADRGGHLEAEGEDERGDDDESAADAEEAGEQADSGGRGDDLEALVGSRAAAAPPPAVTSRCTIGVGSCWPGGLAGV